MKCVGTIADQGGHTLFHDIHIQIAMHHVMRRPFLSKGSLHRFVGSHAPVGSSKLISAASGEERVA